MISTSNAPAVWLLPIVLLVRGLLRGVLSADGMAIHYVMLPLSANRREIADRLVKISFNMIMAWKPKMSAGLIMVAL
jgi:hypothetical protein